ncbi:OmpA family protein [Thioalkalivibrio sp. ALJ16]|uniref:OmpA family protein n=1 Tax=Thioalkalivibrio sp. ALJ16 TaxID=1158762 RepID=UPI00037CF942|nr:OmpA family protein [Thioalkalivibrio sp. ALJ16]
MARLRQWLCRLLPGMLLGALAAGTAGAAPYVEPLERSDWALFDEADVCRIEQAVRHGGSLYFEMRPGLLPAAFWRAPHALPADAVPRLRTGAPEWLRPATKAPLDLRLQAWDERRFRVPQGQVQALQARLLAGHDVRIDFPDSEDSVQFRGIRFALRAQEFRACAGDHALPPAAPETGALGRWSVHFETASAGLDAAARATLGQAVQALGTAAAPRIRVVGWTDAEGPLAVNQALSRERARAVRNALVEAGIARDRIEIEAPGVDPAADGERAASRRADIWWLESGEAAADPGGIQPLQAPGTPRAEDPGGASGTTPPAPATTPAW